jgi:drug/metabolite transporter superfamily protein YnfA
MLSLLKEYWQFLKDEKKQWMFVIVLILLLVGLLVTVTSSAIAPFIYALF